MKTNKKTGEQSPVVSMKSENSLWCEKKNEKNNVKTNEKADETMGMKGYGK